MNITLKEITPYALAVLLVGVFIQTAEVWRWLIAVAGPATAAFVAPGLLALLLVAFAAWARVRRGQPTRAWPVVGGLILALAALWLADPQFPAKRIHVAEYVLLSLVIRYGVAAEADGVRLIVLSAIITALFGLHDELAQGLHPARSFGRMDVAVNGLSGLAGALLAHGLDLAPGHKTMASGTFTALGAVGVIAGVVFLAVAVEPYRDQFIPWWTMTPVLAAGALWFLNPRSAVTTTPVSVAVWLALLIPIYPVLANVTPLVFH